MTVSYKKLWKLLIDRGMKKKDLQTAAGISPSSVSKLSKNEYVSMDVLVKVPRKKCALSGGPPDNASLPAPVSLPFSIVGAMPCRQEIRIPPKVLLATLVFSLPTPPCTHVALAS